MKEKVSKCNFNVNRESYNACLESIGLQGNSGWR